MFEIRIPRNRASRHEPNVIVSTPNASRIPFGTVTVFARRMLAYERLDRRGATFPRAATRRAASTSLSPVGAISAAATVCRPYPRGQTRSEEQRRRIPRERSGQRDLDRGPCPVRLLAASRSRAVDQVCRTDENRTLGVRDHCGGHAAEQG